MDFNDKVKSNNQTSYRLFALNPEDEIVISGISGRFPNSHNVSELAYNLYNKIDCCDDDERRFGHRNDIPKRHGKVYDIEKFDAAFFGYNHKLANATDPQTRCLVEHAYEAVLDAGINPVELKGSNTGVFSSVCSMESSDGLLDLGVFDGYSIVGQNRGMLANRISYAMDFNGPSFVVDSACSSTMMAVNCAYAALRSGECDAAIVGGSNLTLSPIISLMFAKLGVTAMDGYCRPFDKGASGYTRSEAITAIFLQKRKFAKRVYATMVHSKINCDGYKPEGITFPASHVQQRLLDQFYQELNLNPLAVSYVEAHGTGTNVGDPEECEAIYRAFCKNRKEPLLIGSVKSSIGHSEPVSGLCALIKCVFALENGKISPNINFEAIKEEITALKDGHLKVVDEIMDLPGPLVACSSFGFGGANGHVLLKQNPKKKVNYGIPSDGIPRLVCWSGRTEESCNVIFDDIVKRPLDAEFVGLIHSCQSISIQANMYRGYGVFTQEGEGHAVCAAREIIRSKGACVPMVWVYSGMGSQWTQMGSSLMSLPIFRSSIEASHRILEKKGLNLIEIITSDNPKGFDNIVHSFVGIAAIQIGLTNILREMNIKPDYIIGHSVGELGCAYADDCLTAEEMVLCAYSRGMASLETKVVHGSMAAIGLGFEKIRVMLPEGIEAACHNGPNSCTISGPADLVQSFVKELTDKKIFAREVPCSNIPYHSKYIAAMGPTLLKKLENVIKTPKERSPKWLSTSVPKVKWDTPEAKYCSATYQTNNLLSSVLFEETMQLLPENAVTVEIAPHGLLQAILKKAMVSAHHISLAQRGNLNNINVLLSGLGKIYNQGFDIPIDRLYPAVEFPVSAGTPMISHLIKWDHTTDYLVLNFDITNIKRGAEQKIDVAISTKDYEYISGHNIDGRILFPATGYLYLVWNAFARYLIRTNVYSDQPIEMSDIKFIRATPLTKATQAIFSVILHPGTGRFEILESDASVVTGHIKVLEKFIEPPIGYEAPNNDAVVLETSDFYKELKLRGYYYGGEFKSIIEATSDASRAKILWNNNIVSLMDCMLQTSIIGFDSRSLMVPTAIERIQIDPKIFLQSIIKSDEKEYVEVHSIKHLQVIQAKGIRMQGLKANTIMRRKPPGEPVLESYQFVPYLLPQNLDIANALRVFVQLGLETTPGLKFKVLEIGDSTYQPIIGFVQSALDDLPMISAELTLLSDNSELDIPGVTIESDKTISNHMDCLFIIGNNIASDSSKLDEISKSCKNFGFIISTESYDYGSGLLPFESNFQIISVIPVDGYSIVMIQYVKKRVESISTYLKISMNDKEFEWLDKAKEGVKQGKLVIVAQNEPQNGIIGFVNCLRREPKCDAVCIFIDDETAPSFDPELHFYKQQIEKGLAINVYRDGVWGSYRHLPLNSRNDPRPQTSHCFASNMVKGDLSSINWFGGNLDITDSDIVRVRYASLNFRDVMISTGKLDLSMMYSRLKQECTTGLEYSGITQEGKRVMGMLGYGATATHVKKREFVTLEVPPHWTLEEAATIPVVYFTVYTCFFVETRIEKGKKILIHAGTGGIGLAAIRVALHYGLEVFSTVSTEEKKQYLLSLFPGLDASHIGNSRDTSFYDMVMTETKGYGVDFVLNSLADDKLITSLRCLAENGHFMEIGKYDMLNDSKIGLSHFLKNIKFHAIMLDTYLNHDDPEKFGKLYQMINKDLESGVITPLKTTVFEATEMEKAFRYLASAKHIGKVLIKVRDDDFKQESMPIVMHPMVYFKPNLSYIIPGGLGGFGLELSDWMVLRGCRKLVLSSSRGISKPYQQYRINIWRSYGVHVTVNTADIQTPEGCLDLVKEGLKLGPVGGIFNLAVLLRDNIFENQDAEKFKESLSVKAYATKYLDEISRKLCPHLEHFVVFSSVSCGRGNAGQTNYGMANSVMERIVEKRINDGFPGKAIQWGAVGEVGLVAQMAENKIDMEIGGTLQQRIASCLKVLDQLLSCPDAVVASMVVAEKKTMGGSGILGTVMHIIGIKDLKSIPLDQKLSEVGMDSLMAVEIKQTLERDYDLILSPLDLRNLTIQRLIDMSNKKATDETNNASNSQNQDLAFLFRSLGDEETSSELIMKLNTKRETKNSVIIFPGIECVAGKVWYDIASKLNFSAAIVQVFNTSKGTTIDEIVDEIVDKVVEQTMKESETFSIIGYSFGSLLALSLVNRLENLGMKGKIVLIEGSPLYLKSGVIKTDFSDLQFYCALFVMSLISPNRSQEELLKCKDFEEMIEYIMSAADSPYSPEYGRKMMHLLYKHTCIVHSLDIENFAKIKSNITLVGASKPMLQNIDKDYALSNHTSGEVDIKSIEGNHSTILDSEDLVQLLNEVLE